jgi:hypothetical protein
MLRVCKPCETVLQAQNAGDSSSMSLGDDILEMGVHSRLEDCAGDLRGGAEGSPGRHPVFACRGVGVWA